VGHVLRRHTVRTGVIVFVVDGRKRDARGPGGPKLIFISVFGRTMAIVFIAVTATGRAYLI